MRSSSKAVRAGMSAASVLIDRPAEAVAAAGYMVQRRAGTDLVEVDAHRLRSVEGADDTPVANAGQPQIVLDSLVIPPHANICSHASRTEALLLNAGAGLFHPVGSELVERFRPRFRAQRRQQGDQVASGAERLLGPGAE